MKAKGDVYTKPGRTPGRVVWQVEVCKLGQRTKGTFTLHDCSGSASIELCAADAAGRAAVLQALRTAQKELADCIAAYKRACALIARFEAIDLRTAPVKGTPYEPSTEDLVPESLWTGMPTMQVYSEEDGGMITVPTIEWTKETVRVWRKLIEGQDG